MPVSRFVGTPGEKLSDLKLTITKVRIEDDSYKTQIIRGTEYFYVDQLLTAVDIAGNYFLLRIKRKIVVLPRKRCHRALMLSK